MKQTFSIAVLASFTFTTLALQSEAIATVHLSRNCSLSSNLDICKIASATTTISDEVWEQLNQAREAEANGQLDQAISIYQSVLSKPLPQDNQVNVYIKLGDLLQKQQKYQDAIASYQAAHQLSPKIMGAWVGQAQSLAKLSELTLAKQTLTQAKQHLSANITTLEELINYSSLSATYRELGEFAESIALMETALRLNPYITNGASCTFTKEGLRHLRLDFGVLTQKYRSARCSLSALPPDSAIQTWGEVEEVISEAVEQQGLYPKTFQKTGLKRLVSIIPHDLFEPDTPTDRIDQAMAISSLNLGTGLINRAIAMGHSDSMDAAISFLKTSVQHDSRYAWNHMYLSIALLAQGQTQEAIASLNQVLALPAQDGKEPGNTWVWAHNNLGYALEQQGQPEEAARAYEKALDLDPEFTTAKENLDNLRQSQER